MKKTDGYTILLLMFAVFVMSIGLMIAVPVWQTQIQREKEAELIFRGKQYVEAIRLFQRKRPGAFPKDFEELIEEKCLRKLFEDPMSSDGKWNLILMSQGPISRRTRQPRRVSRGTRTTQESIKIYYDQKSYDKWLFFYGQDPKKMPEIVYYGQKEKD